jgi:predicted AAA+ superfamily ATPase
MKGARQIGKTYLIREFAKSYPVLHEFNFQQTPQLKSIFVKSLAPEKILFELEQVSGRKININHELLFFDEIQDCPEALTSLKYFCEWNQQGHVIAAGSLLGIYLNETSFPVGKVDFLEHFPLSFEEFLLALESYDEKSTSRKYSDYLGSAQELALPVHQELIDLLKIYYIIGGMPEVLITYLTTKDLHLVREKQLTLLNTYRADFAKHSGAANALHINSIFENIPAQLAKENKKFQMKMVKISDSYDRLRPAIEWLKGAGLVYKIPIIEHAETPLKIHQKENCFKLYFFDVGLLAALAELPINSFIVQDQLFTTFKGSFSENFFLQEFRAGRKESLYCWSSRTSEVEFVWQSEQGLFPIEVKSGMSGKLKSMNVFTAKYHPRYRTKVSLLPLQIREKEQFRNFPLYFAVHV